MTDDELQTNLYRDDGYRAVVVDNRPLTLAVYAEAVAQGRSAAATIPELEPVLVYEARAGDTRAFGASSRVEHLLDALCRFFNTGGTRDQLRDVLTRTGGFFREPLAIPGYYLFETYLNTDNVYEHVFVSDDHDDAVVWAEGSFVNLVPGAIVLERLADNGRLPSVTFLETVLAERDFRRAADGDAAEDQADLAELPGGEDPPGA